MSSVEGNQVARPADRLIGCRSTGEVPATVAGLGGAVAADDRWIRIVSFASRDLVARLADRLIEI